MTEATNDPFDLEGQERASEDRVRKDRLEAQAEAALIKWLMSGKKGRRIMFLLLDRAGVHRSSFTGNSETFFREGQRNIGLIYEALIFDHAPEAYSTMIEENRAKQ